MVSMMYYDDQDTSVAPVWMGPDHDYQLDNHHHIESDFDGHNCFDDLIDHNDHNDYDEHDGRDDQNEYDDHDHHDDQDSSEAGHSSTNRQGPDNDNEDHPHY